MKTVELWREGYACTGNRSGATHIGTYEADSIDRAVEMAVKSGAMGTKYLEKGHDGIWRDWWRRIFDNETDARKSFG